MFPPTKWVTHFHVLNSIDMDLHINLLSKCLRHLDYTDVINNLQKITNTLRRA